MTVASETNRSGPYLGNGVTTVFAYDFRILDESHIKVIRVEDGVSAVLALGTNYTVTGVGNSGGGSITMTVAPTVLQTISILRDVPFTQETDLENQGPYFAETIEAALDLAAMRDQEMKEVADRSIHFADGDPVLDSQLLPVDARKNKLLGFGTSGELIYTTGPNFVGSTATGVADVDSRSTAQVTTFGASVNVVRTSGVATPGDGGGQLYKRGAGPNSFVDGGAVSWVPVADRNVGSVVISTRAVAATLAFPAHVLYLVTGGSAIVGDGGAATYKRGTGAGSFADAGGVSWVPTQAATVTLAGFGAIGDGTTNNLTAVNNAIAAAGWRGVLELPLDSAGGVYHCSAAPSNPKGVYLRGPGYIQIPEATTNRPRRWDLRGEQYPIVEGKEYLGILHEIWRQGSGAIALTKIEFLGDSTSLGAGVADANYVVPTLVQNNLLLHGFNCTFVNRAVSGTTSEQLRTSQVPASIANAPHLVFIRTGINDPYLRGSAPGVNHTEAQTQEVAELVRVSLDTALASYRASFDAGRTAIVLMTPSVSTLTIDGRDERYLETISPVYRELARKYQCVFIDTYRAWRNGRLPAFSVGRSWLDTVYTAPDGGVHPNESFDVQIADLITTTILPETLRRAFQAGLPQLNNAPGLTNGWSNYAGTAVYARRRGQVVQVEGSVVPGTTTAGTVLTTLPTGMRPARRRYFGAITNATGQAPALLYLDPDGTLAVQTWPSGATFASLECIHYIVGD